MYGVTIVYTNYIYYSNIVMDALVTDFLSNFYNRRTRHMDFFDCFFKFLYYLVELIILLVLYFCTMKSLFDAIPWLVISFHVILAIVVYLACTNPSSINGSSENANFDNVNDVNRIGSDDSNYSYNDFSSKQQSVRYEEEDDSYDGFYMQREEEYREEYGNDYEDAIQDEWEEHRR